MKLGPDIRHSGDTANVALKCSHCMMGTNTIKTKALCKMYTFSGNTSFVLEIKQVCYVINAVTESDHE